jgi:hypothetical protein
VARNTVARWEMGALPIPRWVEIVFERDFGKRYVLDENARLRTEVSALKGALAAVRKGKGDPREVRRLQSQLASSDQTITELRREIARLSKGRPQVWESPERPFIRSRVRRQAAQDAQELRKG